MIADSHCWNIRSFNDWINHQYSVQAGSALHYYLLYNCWESDHHYIRKSNNVDFFFLMRYVTPHYYICIQSYLQSDLFSIPIITIRKFLPYNQYLNAGWSSPSSTTSARVIPSNPHFCWYAGSSYSWTSSGRGAGPYFSSLLLFSRLFMMYKRSAIEPFKRQNAIAVACPGWKRGASLLRYAWEETIPPELPAEKTRPMQMAFLSKSYISAMTLTVTRVIHTVITPSVTGPCNCGGDKRAGSGRRHVHGKV